MNRLPRRSRRPPILASHDSTDTVCGNYLKSKGGHHQPWGCSWRDSLPYRRPSLYPPIHRCALLLLLDSSMRSKVNTRSGKSGTEKIFEASAVEEESAREELRLHPKRQTETCQPNHVKHTLTKAENEDSNHTSWKVVVPNTIKDKNMAKKRAFK